MDGPATAIPGAPALSDNSRPVFNWLFGAGLLWRGYTAVVGGIIIVAVWTTDRGSSAVISTRGGSSDRSSTYGGRTDAYRHSRAHTTVDATTVNAAAVNA